MNRTIRLTFYSTLFILLLLIQSFNSSLSAQNKGGRSVTTQLKELTSKYKIKLSFNPALTDTIYTNIRLAGSSFALDLEQLLQDTGLEFRGVGRQFVVYKAIIEEEEEEESALVLPPPVEKRLVRDINPLSENDFLEESFSADVTPLQMLHSLRKGRLHDGGYYTN